MEPNDKNILYKTVKWLIHKKKLQICIHDTSGVLHNNPMLSLPLEYSIHSSSFCDQAKSTVSGLRACLKCKACSIKKAMSLKTTYIGQCYMGITEIVTPVYHNERPICIIYIGNLVILNQLDQVKDKLQRSCERTGVNADFMLNALDSVEQVTEKDLDEYAEIADILQHCILSALKGNIKLGRSSDALSPIYYGTLHWVIVSVENYVSMYYNKEIRLSQLAKLYFINPQYLCRLFKHETGTNFSDYINKIRLNKAKELLSATLDKIVDISLQVGFNNVTYFNRLFKKSTGMAPGEFRKIRNG